MPMSIMLILLESKLLESFIHLLTYPRYPLNFSCLKFVLLFCFSDLAAKRINDWVSLRTKNKITNLISPSDLNLNTQMILVNALYFNAKWFRSFDPRNTFPETFYSNRGPQTVPMMHHNMKMRYADIGEMDCTMAEIPYKDYEYALYIALPKRHDGLRDLENQVTMLLETARNELYASEVNITLPKFTLEDKTHYNRILQQVRYLNSQMTTFTWHTKFNQRQQML